MCYNLSSVNDLEIHMLMVSYRSPDCDNVWFKQAAKDLVPTWAVALHYYFDESLRFMLEAA